GGPLRDEQPVGAPGDLGRPGDDLGRIADAVHAHDVVDVVPLDLPGKRGERHQMVGDHDHPVRVERVGEGEVEGAAGGRTVDAVRVAEGVGARRRDDGDVDVDLAVLDGLPAAAV